MPPWRGVDRLRAANNAQAIHGPATTRHAMELAPLTRVSTAALRRRQRRAAIAFSRKEVPERTMAKPLPLPVWDRKGGKLIQEFMDDHPATYETRPRRSLTQWLESNRVYDWLVAAYQNSSWSAREIAPFISKNRIDMSEFKPDKYKSFADFFDREFRPGVRSFPTAPGEMGAFSEARYFAWQRLERDQKFPIKGHSLDAERILGSAEMAGSYVDGPIILARLAPVDYHHNHYPDDGRTVSSSWLGGPLWTVNPHAL
jgi:phosphatidylserine decarboxylase